MIFTTKGTSAEDLIQSREVQSNDTIKSILNRLKSQGIYAICAGGAVRDGRLGKYIQDIDIYMRNSKEITPFLQRINPEKLTSNPFHNYKGVSSEIEDVYQTHKLGICIQFIIVNTTDLVDFVNRTFDSDICKCWHDTNGVHYSEEFENAVKTNTISLSSMLKEENRNYSLQKHFPRLIFKFKEYRFDLGISLSQLPRDNILFNYFKAVPKSSLYEKLYSPKIWGKDFYLVPNGRI